MDIYLSLADSYDKLTWDVDYRKFCDFYEKIFEKRGKKPNLVLDLACGTGTLTCMLAERGYEMIGADASSEMLSVAMDKSYDMEADKRPVWINQEMQALDLYGTVDAVVCSLDGINYVSPEDLPEVFRRVSLFLDPNGCFIFDINSKYKLENLDGQVFVDENEDTFCVWRTEIEDNCCFYGIDIFVKKGKMWQREKEEHTEYIYTEKQLEDALLRAGFKNVSFFGNLSEKEPADKEERIFVLAEKQAKIG